MFYITIRQRMFFIIIHPDWKVFRFTVSTVSCPRSVVTGSAELGRHLVWLNHFKSCHYCHSGTFSTIFPKQSGFAMRSRNTSSVTYSTSFLCFLSSCLIWRIVWWNLCGTVSEVRQDKGYDFHAESDFSITFAATSLADFWYNVFMCLCYLQNKARCASFPVCIESVFSLHFVLLRVNFQNICCVCLIFYTASLVGVIKKQKLFQTRHDHQLIHIISSPAFYSSKYGITSKWLHCN